MNVAAAIVVSVAGDFVSLERRLHERLVANLPMPLDRGATRPGRGLFAYDEANSLRAEMGARVVHVHRCVSDLIVSQADSIGERCVEVSDIAFVLLPRVSIHSETQ